MVNNQYKSEDDMYGVSLYAQASCGGGPVCVRSVFWPPVSMWSDGVSDRPTYHYIQLGTVQN